MMNSYFIVTNRLKMHLSLIMSSYLKVGSIVA